MDARQHKSAEPIPIHPETPALPRRLHAVLRGWYFWCGLATWSGLVIGVVLGYRSAEPLYRSTGLIEIQTTPAAWPGQTRASHEAEPDHSLLERQMVQLRSRQRVLHAMASPPWQALGRQMSFAELESFQNHLAVKRAPGTQSQIEVAFTDTDPLAAAVAVRSLIEGHQQALAKQVRNDKLHHAQRIQRQHRNLQKQRAQTKAQMAQIQSEVGPIPIKRVYKASMSRLVHIESLLQGTREAMKLAQTRDPDRALDDQILAKLASVDTTFQRQLLAKQDLQRKWDRLMQQTGRDMPKLVDLRKQLQAAEGRIGQYVRNDRPDAIDLNYTFGPDSEPLTLADLQTRQQRLELAYERMQSRTATAKQQQAQFHTLAAKRNALNQQIDEAKLKLDQLGGKNPPGPQIKVLSSGEEPFAAHTDPRPYRALICASMGGFLGLAVVLGTAMFDRRMLRPDSATLGRLYSPLLGTVPDLSKRAKPAEGDFAALCIHEIRALLQIRAEADGAKAFAITSPSSGSGKTTLTVGLASSLALGGTRTLLINCDLANRIPATKFPAQATSPAMTAPRSNMPGFGTEPRAYNDQVQNLDQAMVQIGYLGERDAKMILAPNGSHKGILGVLQGLPLSQCVINTNVPNLSILPALAAHANDVGKMSSKLMSRLIEDARSQYDIILFDTGPIPGSVEALFVTSEADAVILVVSRGELQSRFNHTLEQLKLVGASLAGTVFNRTDTKNLSPLPGSKERRAWLKQAWRRELRGQPNQSRHARLSPGSGILAAAVDAQSEFRPYSAPPFPNASPDQPYPPTEAGPQPVPVTIDQMSTGRVATSPEHRVIDDTDNREGVELHSQHHDGDDDMRDHNNELDALARELLADEALKEGGNPSRPSLANKSLRGEELDARARELVEEDALRRAGLAPVSQHNDVEASDNLDAQIQKLLDEAALQVSDGPGHQHG